MRKNLLISTISSLLFNTAIAGLLTLVGFEEFTVNFVYSQCIGLSIYAINAWVLCRARRRLPLLALSFPGSILLGITLASFITGVGDWRDPRAWISVVIGLFFGGIGGFTYFLSERIEKLDARVREQELRKSEAEKREIEAHLKLLQAQIEPHFLFNTLANVASLIDNDPVLAKELLSRLNDWLRVALARARSSDANLGDELDMLENYLRILKIRFGERLNWKIDAPAEVRLTSFPPMLLQPLVENAVRHGIEPKREGGEIVVKAALSGEKLQIEVADDGAGFGDGAEGAGLANVRARLSALFGAQATLFFSDRAPGAVARMELPA